MNVLFGALNGRLALITQRPFLFFEHLAGAAQVGVDLASQLLGLSAGGVLRVLQQALGVASV